MDFKITTTTNTTTNLLHTSPISVILNVSYCPASKEEIINLIVIFQQNIASDEKARNATEVLNYFLDSLLSLHKLLVIDKLYDEFTE